MPYTCVYRSVTGVLASVASRGCSRLGRARAAGHRGATPGRPGERAAAASGLAPTSRARPAVGALLLLAHQRGSLACASRARQQKAQKPRVSNFIARCVFAAVSRSPCKKLLKMCARVALQDAAAR